MKKVIAIGVAMMLGSVVSASAATTYLDDAPGGNGTTYELIQAGENLEITYHWAKWDSSTEGGKVKISDDTEKGEHVAKGGETVVVNVGVLHDDTYPFEVVIKDGGYGPLKVTVPNYACLSGKRETIIVDAHMKTNDTEKLLVALDGGQTFFFDLEDDGYYHTLMIDITCDAIHTVVDEARKFGFETSLEFAERKGIVITRPISRGDAMRGKIKK